MKNIIIRPRLLIFLIILLISVGQAVDIYLPSMPSMVHAFNTTDSLIQFSLSMALIGFAISTPIYGPLSDYYGRRITALTGISIFLLGTLICIFAPNINILLLGRALQGLGFGCSGALGPAILKDVLNGVELAKAYSMVGTAIAVMPVLAPILGGYLQHFFNWRASFGFLLIYALIIFTLFYYKLPETNLTLKQSTLSVKKILRNYFILLKNPQVLGYLIGIMTICAGEFSYIVMLPFLIQNNLEFTPIANGWFMLITASGLIIGGLVSTKLNQLYTTARLITLGLIFILIAVFSMLILAFIIAMNIYSIMLPLFLYTLGMGIFYPNAISGLMNLEVGNSGATSSLMTSLQVLASSATTILVAELPNRTQKPLALVMVILSLIAACAYWKMLHRKI